MAKCKFNDEKFSDCSVYNIVKEKQIDKDDLNNLMMTILIDTLLKQKVPNIITTPIGETNNIQKIFDDLKREIENTKQPDAIKLINEGEMYDKIKNSKLPDNMKDELQI